MIISGKNPSKINFSRNKSNSYCNQYVPSVYLHNSEKLNPGFDDLCEEARELARTQGLKSSLSWLFEAERQGVITTSERIRFSKLIETRNLKNHGGSQYFCVTSKAIQDINAVIRKMNASKTKTKAKSKNKKTTCSRTKKVLLNPEQARNFFIQSKVDNEGYYFDLYIIKTREHGYVIKIMLAPHWREVEYRFREFKIFCSETGCHVYTPTPLTTLEEAERQIACWVNRYAQKLDNDKRYQNQNF